MQDEPILSVRDLSVHFELDEGLVRAVGARHVAFVTAGIPDGARILDVGCGRGVILGALADRGYEVHGIEISEEAASGADPRASVRIASTASGMANCSPTSPAMKRPPRISPRASARRKARTSRPQGGAMGSRATSSRVTTP